jgi:predicted deacylase
VTAEFVPIGVRGVHNVLRHLGMERGVPDVQESPREFRTISLVHATKGGGLRWSAKLMDDVKAGQGIVDIVDVFGDEVERLEAPRDGFLLRKMLFGTVATGAEVAWIAS